MDLTIDADRATLLVDHRKHDPVVEDDELFDFHAKLGEGAEPVVQEATNCRSAFEGSPAARPSRTHRSEEAHYRVDVTLIHSLEDKARKLSQVGVVDSSDIVALTKRRGTSPTSSQGSFERSPASHSSRSIE